MRYSDLEWPFRLLALGLMFGTLALIGWALNKLFYDWLPDDLAVWLGAFATGFGLGGGVGLRVGRKEAASESSPRLPVVH